MADRINEIPADAYNLEVFAIKGDEAYIGFKITNGNFHFIQVPYTYVEKNWPSKENSSEENSFTENRKAPEKGQTTIQEKEKSGRDRKRQV